MLSLIQLIACRSEYPECPAKFLNKTDDRLTIVNNSSERVTYTYSTNYPEDSVNLDRLIPNEQVVNANPGRNIGPHSSYRIINRSCWESRFLSINSGILRVMVINMDSIKAYSATEIVQRKLYKNYLYTLDELRAIDWKVVYP
jgi:hypothetical protein